VTGGPLGPKLPASVVLAFGGWHWLHKIQNHWPWTRYVGTHLDWDKGWRQLWTYEKDDLQCYRVKRPIAFV